MEIRTCPLCRRAMREGDKYTAIRIRDGGLEAVRNYVETVNPKAPPVECNGLYMACSECKAVYVHAAGLDGASNEDLM